MFEYLKNAKQIEEELFQKLKALPRNDRYIHVYGEDGYFCIMAFFSRKNTINRVGRFEKLIDIVEGCLLEYCVISQKGFDTLNFDAIKFEEVKKLCPNFNKNGWCMYNGEFFKNV